MCMCMYVYQQTIHVNLQQQLSSSSSFLFIASYLLVSSHPLLVEVVHSLHDLIDLVFRGQNGGADMVSSLLLSESTSRHAHDSGLVEEIHAVHGIGGSSLLLGLLDGLGRHGEAEVGVESTVHRQAGHAVQLVQSGRQLLRAHLQRLQNAVLLLLEELVGGITGLGRVDHHVHGVLAVHVRAAADRQQLVQLGAHVIGEVHQLHVATAASALTPVSLRGRVEGHHLAVQTQLAHHLLEGDELVARAVDVLLVHLIGHDHDVLARADLANVLDVLASEALAGRVARVHRSDRLHRQTLRAGALDRLLNVSGVQSPVVLLVQIVGLVLASEHVDRSRVQRVLGNGNQNAIRRLVNQQLQAVLNTLGSTVRQENVLGISGETVTLRNVSSHILQNLTHSSSLRVGTRTTGVGSQQLLGSLDGIGVEHLRMLLSNLGPGGDAQHLTQEGDGLLANSLRITDVAVKQRIEGELLALLHLGVNLVSANHNLSTDSIVSSANVLVDVVNSNAGGERSQSRKMFTMRSI